jgi:thiamine kinase-like enzyme
VNNLLDSLSIKHPKVITYDRNSKEFNGGYLIEEFIDGVNPLEIFNDKQMRLAYKSLAKYIKKVHTIQFDKFGYLNNGEPYYDKFSEYIEDTLTDNLTTLIKHNIIKMENMEHFVKSYSAYFDCFDYPAVLCHGDLSMRNVLTIGSDLTLIDWDDAMAYPAFADVARMTFDMRYIHDNKYHLFTLSFLSEYIEEDQINNYLRFESLYHVFVAFDFLAHSIDKINKEEKYNKMIKYLEYLLEKL